MLAAWCIAKERWVLGTLLLGLCVAMKETALLIVIPMLLFVAARRGIRHAARWATMPLLVAILFFVKNRMLYGTWWATFQPFEVGDPIRGALQIFVDPSHGLLPFAPLLALAWLGRDLRRTGGAWHRDPGLYALVVIAGYCAVTAAWRMWWGGFCFGPRLLVPVIPAFAIPLARLWAVWGERPLFRIAFYGLSSVGFALQWCAATHPFKAFWSISVPELVGRYPSYFLFGLALAALIFLGLSRIDSKRAAAGAAS